jgi:hypothetical protein
MSAACGGANVTEGTDVAESVVPLACPPGRPPLCGRARWARWSTGGTADLRSHKMSHGSAPARVLRLSHRQRRAFDYLGVREEIF